MNLRSRGLTKTEMLAGFAIKVLMGLIYGYIFLHYYNGDDTWKLFRASLDETQLLLRDPGMFFRNEYTPLHAIQEGNGGMEILKLYLIDLEYAMLVKSLAIVNLVSGGNYYIDVVLFNIIFFFGHYWLFKLMYGLYPFKRKFFFIAIFFFLPAVFWLSGIRAEGFIFFFLSLLLYNLCGSVKQGIKKYILITIGFAGVFLLRPELAVFVALGMMAYIIAGKIKRNPLLVFAAVYAIALVLFFASAAFLSGGGIPALIVEKQQQYLKLNGTRFQLDNLENSPSGFIKILPQAFGNSFLRPFPWEAKGALQLMASAEVVAFWLIVIAAIRNRHSYWKVRLMHPVILMLLFLSISVYLSIGYIVPFPGAIVRYKAIPEILIICCMICISRWGEKSNYRNI